MENFEINLFIYLKTTMLKYHGFLKTFAWKQMHEKLIFLFDAPMHNNSSPVWHHNQLSYNMTSQLNVSRIFWLEHTTE